MSGSNTRQIVLYVSVRGCFVSGRLIVQSRCPVSLLNTHPLTQSRPLESSPTPPASPRAHKACRAIISKNLAASSAKVPGSVPQSKNRRDLSTDTGVIEAQDAINNLASQQTACSSRTKVRWIGARLLVGCVLCNGLRHIRAPLMLDGLPVDFLYFCSADISGRLTF